MDGPRPMDGPPGPDAPMPPGMMLQVPVPEGVSPGQQVDFDTPDGRRMRAEVPAGKKPGDTFEVFEHECEAVIDVECPPGVKPGDQVSVSIPGPGGQNGPPLTVTVPDG